MLIDFYLVDVTKDITMNLPIIPENYEITNEQQIETVKLASVGDINIPTFMQPLEISIEGVFSTRKTTYLRKNLTPQLLARTIDYVHVLRDWQKAKDVIRVVIVPIDDIQDRVNKRCYIKSITINGEYEMLGDIGYTLNFVECPPEEAKPKEKAKTVATRPAPKAKVTPPTKQRIYTVKQGDCLWGIARRYYGNGAQYTKILNANKGKIKNKNLIFPGQVFIIPY